MRVIAWLAGLLALIASVPAAAKSAEGYTYYSIGDVAAKTPGRTATGLMLMGGGDWPYEAWHWFLAKAGNGHIVVLRASGGADAGEEIYRQVGGAASVETLVFDDRKASSDPKVLAILDHADGIFIAGGDQANYVRFWKDTPVAKALDTHVAKGRPIGGTSAGLAILGGSAYGAMDGGSIDSPAALSDPMGPGVTIVRDFLHMPFLAHVVTDTHFAARDRLGRLIAFVAQVRATTDPQAIGLGIDERSALCVDNEGAAKLYTRDTGHAWLVEPQGMPGAVKGKALDWAAVRVTGIGTGSGFELKTRKVRDPAFAANLAVDKGRLSGAGALPGPATAKAAQ